MVKKHSPKWTKTVMAMIPVTHHRFFGGHTINRLSDDATTMPDCLARLNIRSVKKLDQSLNSRKTNN